MKKFLYMAMAVIAALSSCSSDNDIESNENGNDVNKVNAPVFTATIEGNAASRTVLDGNKVNWLNTDQVYIWSIDGDYTLKVLGKYDVSPGSSDASSATLTAASDITFVNAGAGDAFYTVAYYPASMTKLDYTYNQMKSKIDFTEKGKGISLMEAAVFFDLPATQKFNGDDISQIAPMGALSQGGTNLEFKNLTSLLAITVSADDFTSISKIVVSSDKQMNDLFVFDTSNMVAKAFLESPTDDENTVTLDCKNEGANTAIPSNGSKTFYVSVPVNTYDYLQIDVTDGTTTKTMKTKEGKSISVERNSIYEIAFADNQTPAAVADPNLLTGEFSVGDNKKVQFTKGNLWCNTTTSPVTWAFETNQYDYPVGNDYTSDGTTDGTWFGTHFGHFYWTKTAAASYATSYNDGDNTTSDNYWLKGDVAERTIAVAGTSDLYVLSSEEWKYLFQSRDKASSLYKVNVTVAGQPQCLIIAPDGYTGTIADSYDATAWATAEADGLVCLPAAGYRGSSNLVLSRENVLGFYATSTPDSNKDDALYLSFTGTIGVRTANSQTRKVGIPIRLVKTVQAGEGGNED